VHHTVPEWFARTRTRGHANPRRLPVCSCTKSTSGSATVRTLQLPIMPRTVQHRQVHQCNGSINCTLAAPII